MAEIRTVTTLRRKRDEVRKAVRKYERCLDQARADLTHLIAAIAIFEAKGGDESLPAYADLHRLFRYGEAFKLCQQALASGPKTTRELAVYVANAKGLDGGDTVMRKVIGTKLIHSLRISDLGLPRLARPVAPRPAVDSLDTAIDAGALAAALAGRLARALSARRRALRLGKTEHGLAKSSLRAANMTRSLVELERYLSALKEAGELPTLVPDVSPGAAQRRRSRVAA